MDCFAEPVIGPRVRADPLARNDDSMERNIEVPALFRDREPGTHVTAHR